MKYSFFFCVFFSCVISALTPIEQQQLNICAVLDNIKTAPKHKFLRRLGIPRKTYHNNWLFLIRYQPKITRLLHTELVLMLNRPAPLAIIDGAAIALWVRLPGYAKWWDYLRIFFVINFQIPRNFPLFQTILGLWSTFNVTTSSHTRLGQSITSFYFD